MQMEAQTRSGIQSQESCRSGRTGKLDHPAVAETDSRTNVTVRLHVKDKLSDEVFLIDTGAEISVIPKLKNWRGVPAQFKLYVVNGPR